MVKENGRWVNVSTADFMFGVEELFLGLRALGICPGDRIAIISENRIEWAMADYATGALGAVTVPIYPTLSARQMEYVLRNSGAAVAFVSNAIQLDKLDSVQGGLPDLKFTIVFDESIYRPDRPSIWTRGLLPCAR